MQVIAKRTLKMFWSLHADAENPLRTWHSIAEQATWASPQDIKDAFGAAVDFVGDNRAIFDIGGNKYRLIVRISYLYKRILIKFIGTHAEYDKVNAETV